MKSYTVCFVFNHDLTRVLLIHKNRPEWQNGKLNGLGGKFEEGEDCNQCASREILEESSLDIDPTSWKKVAHIHSEDFLLDVVTTKYLGEESDAKTMEDETIKWFDVHKLPPNIINNLAWLIPMCLNALQNKGIDKYEKSDLYYDITFRR